MQQDELFNNIMLDMDAAYWKLRDISGVASWSDLFYEKLGYGKHSLPETLNYFLEKLIHPDDKKLFRDNFLIYQQYLEYAWLSRCYK